MEKVAPRLYIVSYLDEDVDTDLVAPSRHRGYEAYSVRDVGRRGKTDIEQLAFATERGWALVTHNVRHFKQLHDEWQSGGKEHVGIIVSKRMEIGRMLRALSNLLDRVSADEVRNQLLYLQNFE